MDNERQEDRTRPETVRSVAEQATDDMRGRVEEQKSRAADTAQRAADSARHAAHDLRREDAWMAGLVEQGAEKLTDLAETLRSNDLRTLLARTEDFARRQPVLFTGAAMALGFALTRAVSMAQQPASGELQTSRQEVRHDV
jgi:ElaB/YqjD/DUF883 family membrane-anchored ribosome-binding protein